MLKVFTQSNDIPPNPKVKEFLRVFFMLATAVYVGDLRINISGPIVLELILKWEEKSVGLEHLIIQRHQEERYFCRKRKY